MVANPNNVEIVVEGVVKERVGELTTAGTAEFLPKRYALWSVDVVRLLVGSGSCDALILQNQEVFTLPDGRRSLVRFPYMPSAGQRAIFYLDDSCAGIEPRPDHFCLTGQFPGRTGPYGIHDGSVSIRRDGQFVTEHVNDFIARLVAVAKAAGRATG